MTESRTMTWPTGPIAPVDTSRPHFVGIGGSGMSALAKIFAARGSRVSGSDAEASPTLAMLAAEGYHVHAWHAAANVDGATCVVVSTAIDRSNPEVLAAKARGIQVIHRAQALAMLMSGHQAVAVTGSHGKSSTTAMLATVLRELGMNPSHAVGADVTGPGSGACHGSGRTFIAEADESDRSFLALRPDVALILNVDDDHPENYADLAAHVSAHTAFGRCVTPSGTLIANADDPATRRVIARLQRGSPHPRILTYGAAPDAGVRIVNTQTCGWASLTTVAMREGAHLTIAMTIPGRHLAHNAVGALAVARELGADPRAVADALAGYRGIARRFTRIGEVNRVTVVDSYACHPTEIAADLETARSLTEGRVIVVFQPSGVARTWARGTRAGHALAAADVVLLLDIYGRTGSQGPGATSKIVGDAVKANGGTVLAEPERSIVPLRITELARPGDIVLTMGTGDVASLGRGIVDHDHSPVPEHA